MKIQDLFESPQLCSKCGGVSFSDLILAEKKDACYYKVKASAKVWPSAYASGRLVQCRKKGAANYGKSKNESMAEGLNEMDKSAPQPGRDGKVSHSTYGSRDKKGSDYFKGKEAPGKPITKKQMEKDALDILKKQGVAEDAALAEEFDLIESTVERLAKHNDVDAETIWEDLESLSNDELYVFAVTMPLTEDWQKANKKDRTDGMSRKAVKAYRREHPGSKLKTAVTTKPSKLKRGSKASKRRKSYCSRSRGQMKMHSISCAKTPDKAICKARRRWNCE